MKKYEFQVSDGPPYYQKYDEEFYLASEVDAELARQSSSVRFEVPAYVDFGGFLRTPTGKQLLYASGLTDGESAAAESLQAFHGYAVKVEIVVTPRPTEGGVES